LMSNKARNIQIFDIKDSKLLIFEDDQNFIDGYDCKLSRFYITCKYLEEQLEILRTFIIRGQQIKELKGIERSIRRCVT
jgi:hypothetical protein